MIKQYIPERNHIIWLDFEPTRGKEIGKYRPALVLSSKEYNNKSGLLICCPISTSIGCVLTEVAVNNLDQPSVVATNLIQTLSWKERKAKLITQAESNIQGTRYFSSPQGWGFRGRPDQEAGSVRFDNPGEHSGFNP